MQPNVLIGLFMHFPFQMFTFMLKLHAFKSVNTMLISIYCCCSWLMFKSSGVTWSSLMLLLWSYWSNRDACATEAVSLSKEVFFLLFLVSQFSKRFDSTFWTKLIRSSILWRSGGGARYKVWQCPVTTAGRRAARILPGPSVYLPHTY